MKKLFQLSPLLELNDYQTLKIIGSYQIEHIDERQCTFQHETYVITIEADEIQVKALQERQVIVFINGFRHMTVKKKNEDD